MTRTRHTVRAGSRLPFPALVEVEPAQQALLLLAVEPRLRGVALAAPAGTGKTSLARGLRTLLGDDGVPFVELPPSVDVENLLGGLDLEATLRCGQLMMQPGVLARAHGGIAYLDGVNLLTDGTANLLLSVLDEGEVRVEREGVSLRHPARFSLVTSYDPAEGQPRRHLLDRLGLLVHLPGAFDAAGRRRVIEHNLLNPLDAWDEDLNFLRGLIVTARDHLPRVEIDATAQRRLSLAALQFGVEGHRADLFATRAALASAALALRDEVEDEDLEVALRLVILPRATRIPSPPSPERQPPPPPEPAQDEADETPDSTPPDSLPMPTDQVFEALMTELPDEIEALPFLNLRRGRSGSRGATEGKRGRHVRSIPGDPKTARLDVVATLRAAAPWQRLRAKPGSGRRIHLHISDVRVKQYRSKAGALFCFVVDASGSMALHRMRQAKGAAHALLQRAYVHRDRVAVIAFRGAKAELLLPPTQSVELARRALDLLPTGGGTPLASALLLADEVAAQARMRGILQTVLIVLTDGRANVSVREGGNPEEELQQLGVHLRDSNLRVVIVDTKRSYLSRGEARQLAEWLGGDYAYLPNASGEQISQLATHITHESV